MAFNALQRAAILKAERTRDKEAIAAAIYAALEDAPGTTMFDVEMVFRDAGALVFLVASDAEHGHMKICLGVREMLDALSAAGMTGAKNREALKEIG